MQNATNFSIINFDIKYLAFNVFRIWDPCADYCTMQHIYCIVIVDHLIHSIFIIMDFVLLVYDYFITGRKAAQ